MATVLEVNPSDALLWLEFGGQYTGSDGKRRIDNLATRADAPANVLCGDGITSSTFPTQLTDRRGVSFDGYKYIDTGIVDRFERTDKFTLFVASALNLSNNINSINEITNTYSPGSYSFIGSCFDGTSVWFAPYSSTKFIKINTNTGVITEIATNTYGAATFYGCCFDGYSVWFSPVGSGATTKFVKIETITNTKTEIANTYGSSAFTKNCFDGYSVWFPPANSTKFVKINITTNAITEIANTYGANAFAASCFDGTSVWFAPSDSTKFVKINATTNAITEIANGYGTNAFTTCCFDGYSVWFAPANSAKFVKINTTTNAITEITKTYGNDAFYGCRFDGTYVWFSPYNSAKIVKINATTNAITEITNTYGTKAFFGCCFDGTSIWLDPCNSTKFVKINTSSTGSIISCNNQAAINPDYTQCGISISGDASNILTTSLSNKSVSNENQKTNSTNNLRQIKTLAMSYSGTDQTVYVDGIATSMTTISNNLISTIKSSKSFLLGGMFSGNYIRNNITGNIYFAAIFPKELTAIQIANLHKKVMRRINQP